MSSNPVRFVVHFNSIIIKKYTICEILCYPPYIYKNLVQILKVTPILLVYSTLITELYIFVDVRYSLKLLPLLLVPRIIVLILGIFLILLYKPMYSILSTLPGGT
jgi:hypothetical protein